MQLIVDPLIQQYFSTEHPLFEQIMRMHGQVFRELEGRRTQRIALGEDTYFLKQHFGVGWQEIFKNLFQFRLPVVSARNEWQAIQLLKKLAIPTMQVAAFGLRGANPARCQSFILTHELMEVVSLEDFCLNWQQFPVSLKWRIIKEVARIARMMHQHGMNHRDFYICHFLLDKNTLTAHAPTLFLIDLHRAQIRRATPLRWLIKDLAGLYFSSKDIGLTSRDLLRFIREYREQGLHHIIPKEIQFWQKVQTRGDKTYQRHGH